MHPALAEKMLEGCRERAGEGRTILPDSAPHSAERYEDCIVELGRQRDALAKATLKIMPHLSRNLGSEADIRSVEAILKTLK